MNNFFRDAISRKVLAAVLVLLLSACAVFASPFKVSGSLGSAAVYDSSYKAVKDAEGLMDGYLIKTAENSVIFTNGTAEIEVQGNSLVKFTKLDSRTEIYVLYGKASVFSVESFTVRTPVTIYNAKAGSKLYVITTDDEETAYVDTGNAKATNLITGTLTDIEANSYIDNSRGGFKPENTTLAGYWKTSDNSKNYAAGAERMPSAQIVQKETELAATARESAASAEKAAAAEPEKTAVTAPETEKDKTAETAEPAGPLTKTFTFMGYSASIEAYTGIAYLTYPDFVTNQELIAAAAAAVWKYPQYTQGISYRIIEPGKAEIYYPQSYGEPEFRLAASLLENEIPAYVAEVLGLPASDTVQNIAKAQTEENPATSAETNTEQAAAPEAPAAPAAETQTTTEVQISGQETNPAETKTPLATSPRPEKTEEKKPEKEPAEFKFGATAGAVFGNSVPDTYYHAINRLHNRVGVYIHNLNLYFDPYITYNGFTFGLHIEENVILKPFKLTNPLTFNSNGWTNRINSLMNYISVIGIETEKFSLRADRTTELDFISPVIDESSRMYDNDSKLLATMKYNSGKIKVSAFFDDLKLSGRLEGRSQFAGLRTDLKYGDIVIGAGAVAEITPQVSQSMIYPSLDFIIPFTLGDSAAKLSASVAAELNRAGARASLVEGKFEITEGILTIGFSASYNQNYHFNNLINNGPSTVTKQYQGSSLDAGISAVINTKHFALSGSFTLPLSVGNKFGKLAYNTVITRSGKIENISADTFNFRADLMFGNFMFSAGAAYNGLSGKLASTLKDFINNGRAGVSLGKLADTENASFYGIMQLDINNFNFYVRADIARINGTLTMPVSAGTKISF